MCPMREGKVAIRGRLVVLGPRSVAITACLVRVGAWLVGMRAVCVQDDVGCAVDCGRHTVE
jgi:hypothetical protein